MDNSEYIVVQKWMVSLGLKGSDLLVFALINGFCQDGESDFHGSTSYVADWCGVSRRQAVTILQRLTDGGYLLKTGEPGYPSHYRIDKEGGVKKLHMCNNFTGGVKKLHTGCEETSHNNIDDNIDIIYNTHSLPRAREDEKKTYGDKVLLTSREYDQLVEKFGSSDADRLVGILDDYLVNHPRKKYASHYRAILSWCVNKLQEEKLTEQRLTNAQEASKRISGQTAIPAKDRLSKAEADRRQALIDAKYQ